MKQVIINGKAYSYTEEQTILRLLHGISIAIPALCNDDRFAPASVCRSCLEKKTATIHSPPVVRFLLPMEIETHTLFGLKRSGPETYPYFSGN